MPNERIKQGEQARDFTLLGSQGNKVSLSDFFGQKNVFLVFNRGFG